jgi:hypothetical protein
MKPAPNTPPDAAQMKVLAGTVGTLYTELLRQGIEPKAAVDLTLGLLHGAQRIAQEQAQVGLDPLFKSIFNLKGQG